MTNEEALRGARELAEENGIDFAALSPEDREGLVAEVAGQGQETPHEHSLRAIYLAAEAAWAACHALDANEGDPAALVDSYVLPAVYALGEAYVTGVVGYSHPELRRSIATAVENGWPSLRPAFAAFNELAHNSGHVTPVLPE